MKLSPFLLILLCGQLLYFSLSPACATETATNEGQAAVLLAEQLTENLEKSPLNLKVRRLTLEGSQVSSEFADYLLMLIRHELQGNADDFPSVGEVRRSLTRGGITVQANPQEDSQAHDAFLEGAYRVAGEQVVVELRLAEADGSSVSRGEIRLPLSGVKHELQPPNLQVVVNNEKEAAQIAVPPPQDFAIELGLNKDDGAVFRAGDALKIFFRSAEDCYLFLWYQDAQGNRYILYPLTEKQRETPLKARKGYDLTENLPLEVSCDPVCGTETVWAFASTKPLKHSGSVNNLNNSGLRGYPASISLTEILIPQRAVKRRTKKAEARVYLTTVAK